MIGVFLINMKHEVIYSYNHQKLWINSSVDGSNIARFDTRFGMDIHNSITDQMNGKPQCLYCTHTKPTEEDFNTFCKKVKEIFNININKSKIKFKNDEKRNDNISTS